MGVAAAPQPSVDADTTFGIYTPRRPYASRYQILGSGSGTSEPGKMCTKPTAVAAAAGDHTQRPPRDFPFNVVVRFWVLTTGKGSMIVALDRG